MLAIDILQEYPHPRFLMYVISDALGRLSLSLFCNHNIYLSLLM